MTDKFKETQEKISELYSYTDEVYKGSEEELAMFLVATDKENSTSISCRFWVRVPAQSLTNHRAKKLMNKGK